MSEDDEGGLAAVVAMRSRRGERRLSVVAGRDEPGTGPTGSAEQAEHRGPRAVLRAGPVIRHMFEQVPQVGPLWTVGRQYLRVEALEALVCAANDLAHDGVGLFVAQGYRPLEEQLRIWEAAGGRGQAHLGRHPRGTALDAVPFSLASGLAIGPPSPFDEAIWGAEQQMDGNWEDALGWRSCFERAMRTAGLDPAPNEWWHYDLHGWQEGPVLGIGLTELSQGQAWAQSLVLERRDGGGRR